MKLFSILKKVGSESLDKCLSKNVSKSTENNECDLNARILVLGGGCIKCHELEKRVKDALEEIRLNERVVLITDYSVIANFGVMSTPALVIDKKVVSSGSVLSVSKIKELLEKELLQKEL